MPSRKTCIAILVRRPQENSPQRHEATKDIKNSDARSRFLGPASHCHLVQSLDPKRFSEKRRPRYWAQNFPMKYLAFSESIRPASTVNWRGHMPVLWPTVASNWAHFRSFLSLYQQVKVTAKREVRSKRALSFEQDYNLLTAYCSTSAPVRSPSGGC
jgi:hypothetical protein